jgi:hypothetical protein
MEEPEVPTEHLQEEIHAHAERHGQSWTLGVALSSAVLASLAAVASLSAGHYANEAMMSQIESGNQWTYFQSKSIKEAQLKSKTEILEALGKPASDTDKAKMAEYAQDKDQIKTEAEALQKEAKHHLGKHQVLARSVTMFQIAIAVGAISVLTKRKRFWFVSLIFGTVGLFFLLQALLFVQGVPPRGH